MVVSIKLMLVYEKLAVKKKLFAVRVWFEYHFFCDMTSGITNSRKS